MCKCDICEKIDLEQQKALAIYEAEVFKLSFAIYFPTLDFDYISGMNEIGVYGKEKYGDQSFDVKRKAGKLIRDHERVHSSTIRGHAFRHLFDADKGIVHDKFGTIEHQHYAAGFNAMMESIFWKAEQDFKKRYEEGLGELGTY